MAEETTRYIIMYSVLTCIFQSFFPFSLSHYNVVCKFVTKAAGIRIIVSNNARIHDSRGGSRDPVCGSFCRLLLLR